MKDGGEYLGGWDGNCYIRRIGLYISTSATCMLKEIVSFVSFRSLVFLRVSLLHCFVCFKMEQRIFGAEGMETASLGEYLINIPTSVIYFLSIYLLFQPPRV